MCLRVRGAVVFLSLILFYARKGMDRVAALVAQASVLRRTTFASLPFEVRLAEVFTRLSVDTVETLGLAFGAAFLGLGVTDMPDPGPRWKPESRNPALTLPHGYMKEFGGKIYNMVLRRFDPALADDVIQNLLLKLTQGKMKIEPGVSRSQAESYVYRGTMLEGLNLVRERRNQRLNVTDSLDDTGPGDDGRALLDTLEDPHALQHFKNELSSQRWHEWMAHLAKRIHQSIPEFIGFSMQGYDATEIVGDGLPPEVSKKPGMLKDFKPKSRGEATSFIKYKVGRIPEVSREFFRSIGEEVPVAV